MANTGISLDPRARYVTQSGLFDVLRLGPLTDKRIEHYKLMGKYGELAKLRAQLRIQRARESRTRVTKAQTMRKFNKLFSGI